MRILDRYIVRTAAQSYIFVLSVFIGLYFVIDIFSNLSDMLENKPQITVLLSYYINMLPLIFSQISPFSILISVLYTFGELNKNNEIITARASGVSIFRLAIPILVFGMLISFSAFYIQENILVVSQKNVENMKNQFIKKKKSKITEEINFSFPTGDMIIFARKYYPQKGALEGVTIFKDDGKGNITSKMISQKVYYQDKQWHGEGIIEYKLDDSGAIIDKPEHWQDKIIPIDEDPDQLIYKKGSFAEFASLKRLGKELRRLKKIKAVNLLNDLVIEYHQKVAEPFMHFFLIIGVLPFALEIKKRKAALSSLGTGFIFGFSYYAIASFSVALGKTGLILPVFSAWLAPIFFLTVGITGLLILR